MKPPKVENEAQLTALARALELRAAQRFGVLAAQARENERGDLARLFDSLADGKAQEAEDACGLAGLAAAGLPGLPADWLEGLDGAESGPTAADIPRAAPYLALAAAVRGEDAAFTFFSYIAGEAEEPAVKALAEAFAGRKLEQADKLRQARRRAYRRFKAYDRAWPRAAGVGSLAELERAAAGGEAALLALSAAWRDRLPVLAEIEAKLLAQLPGLAARDQESALQEPPGTPEAALRAALDRVQTAFEYYDAVATGAKRQDVMLQAQALTQMSLERIEAIVAALSPGRAD